MHWGKILKIGNTMILHARLRKKFFYYVIKYAQFIHGVVPVRDLQDKNGQDSIRGIFVDFPEDSLGWLYMFQVQRKHIYP